MVGWVVAAHISLACHSARLRLAQIIVDLARDVGHKSSDGVELHVTNEELANAANVTVFTASRLLSKWHRHGVLEKSRGRIRLPDSGRLLMAEV
jgi:CRP/FNR family transcriptional regulator, nitrogen oxide reductase regulator